MIKMSDLRKFEDTKHKMKYIKNGIEQDEVA